MDIQAELDKLEEPQDVVFWKPEVGDTIVGEIVDYEKATFPDGGTAWRCIIKTSDDSGERLVGVTVGVSTLRSQFQKRQPQIGERVGIKRFANHEKGYKQMTVVVDRDPDAPKPPQTHERVFDDRDAGGSAWGDSSAKANPAADAGGDPEVPF